MIFVRSKYIYCLKFLTFVLAIFPYFKIIPVNAEINPAFLIPLSLLFLTRIGVNPLSLFIFFYLLCFLLISLIVNVSLETIVIYETFGAYIAPLTLLFVFLSNSRARINLDDAYRYSKILVYILLPLGIFQFFAPALIESTGLNFLLESILSRYRGEAILEGSGRGIRFIAPEPSYAAFSLFSLVIIFCMSAYRSRTRESVVLLIISIVTLLMTLSTTAFSLLLMLVIFVILVSNNFKMFLSVLGFLAIVMVLFFGMMELLEISKPRFLIALEKFIEAFISGVNLFEIFSVLDNGRLLSVLIGYLHLFDILLLPQIGRWSIFFYSDLVSSGFYIEQISFFTEVASNVKPFSYFGALSFDLGIWSLPVIFFVFYATHNLHFKSGRIPATEITVTSSRKINDSSVWVALMSSILVISFMQPVSLPVFFMLLVVDYKRDSNVCS